MPSAQSRTNRNSRVGLPVPHTLIASVAVVDRFDALADHAGMTCELGRVEVVARAVQVGRQQVDGVEAVLLAVRLRLDQQHLLGQAVRRVGLLGIARPQVVFAERHRGELGIGADRADRDELLHAGQPRLLHQLGAHDQVLVEELARVARGWRRCRRRPPPGGRSALGCRSRMHAATWSAWSGRSRHAAAR